MNKKLLNAITSYEKRKKEIAVMATQLRMLEISHEEKTKEDFGLVDGEIVGIPTLSLLIEKVSGLLK